MQNSQLSNHRVDVGSLFTHQRALALGTTSDDPLGVLHVLSSIPETAPAECLDATRSDAAAGGGGAGRGGPTVTLRCCGASTSWNSAEAPRWELKIGCILIHVCQQ